MLNVPKSSALSASWRAARSWSGLRMALAGLAAVAALSLATPLPAQPASGTPASGAAPAPKKIDPKDYPKLEKTDALLFKTGNRVEGVLLEESEASVKFLVILGAMRQETTYSKADILKIERNAFKKPDDKKDDKKDDKGTGSDAKKDRPADDASKDDDADKPAAHTEVSDEDAPGTNGKGGEGALKIYTVNLVGEFGRNLSKTPATEIAKEIKRIQPDVVVFRFDFAFAQYGEEKVDFEEDAYQYDELEKARELTTILVDGIENDTSLKTKPRMVAWIKKALGGPAFMAYPFKEIYFASDGRHGGIGGLESMFEGRGDEVAREKQRSLRLGRAEGLALKGGHEERIVRAMSRGDYILSYRINNGEVEFLDRMPPGPEWILLKDDGAVNSEHADSAEDMVRLRGNDYLTLDALTAQRIGWSKGTADTLDDLLVKMGITRNWERVKENRSGAIIRSWSKDVGKAESDFYRLWRSYNRITVRPPGGYRERTAARTQQKNTLREIKSLLEKYREAINPRAIRGAPEGWAGRIDLMINQIEQQQRLDRPGAP